MDKERKFKKAGFFLYGLAPDAQGRERTHVVLPYTEGRFNDHFKSYSPLKGSVDPGEDTLQTALREGGEESGLDIPTLLGASYEDFLAGKTIEGAPGGYPGVTIKRASREPVGDHTYMSAHGARNRTVYTPSSWMASRTFAPSSKASRPTKAVTCPTWCMARRNMRKRAHCRRSWR